MINKVMFVGCGQAGGKIADVAKKCGFPAAYINLSLNDLRALEHADESEKLLIRGDGAGKDRNYAKNMLDINGVVNFFHESTQNREIKIINFVFSTGGGSGSGITPIIIDVLRYEFPDIVFIAMPILPKLDESYIAQVNTVGAMQELSELDIAVFPIDNEQSGERSRSNNHHTLNNRVVQSFCKLLNYTQIDSKVQFDETDLIKLLSEAGNGVIAEIDLASTNSNLTSDGISKAIQLSWDSSVFSSIDKGCVTKAAVIFDGQESLLDYVDIDGIFNVFSVKPMYLFSGTYTNSRGTVMTVLTGLPWCRDRLSEVENLIQINEKKYNHIISDKDKHRYRPSENLNITIRKIAQVPKLEQTKPDWRELLNKYKK